MSLTEMVSWTVKSQSCLLEIRMCIYTLESSLPANIKQDRSLTTSHGDCTVLPSTSGKAMSYQNTLLPNTYRLPLLYMCLGWVGILNTYWLNC